VCRYDAVMAPGMLQMDVFWAAWSWLVILSSGGGLVLMYRVSYNDPGFVGDGEMSERELLKASGGGGFGGGSGGGSGGALHVESS
jgi:hypothetical protein